MGKKRATKAEEQVSPDEVLRTELGLPFVPKEARVNPLMLAIQHAFYALAIVEDEVADSIWCFDVLEVILEYLSRVPKQVLLTSTRKLIDIAKQNNWPHELSAELKNDLKFFKKSKPKW